MRITALIFALLLSLTGSAAAQPPSPRVESQSGPTSQRWLGGPQGTAPASLAEAERGGGEWDEYVNVGDGFKINFPGKPTVTETTWTSQLNYTLPARVYRASRGPERYSLTVVDYSSLEQQGIERSKNCPPGNANCRANAGPALGPGYWRHDERGAIVYATFKLLQRDAKLTNLAWEWQDMVEGHLLQMTNADKSRTAAFVAMHEHKLYVLEGTVPDGYPEPGLFQQSLGWVDKDGNSIRYQTIYSNSYHGMGVYPKPSSGGGRGGGAGAGAGRGAGAGDAGAGAGNRGR